MQASGIRRISRQEYENKHSMQHQLVYHMEERVPLGAIHAFYLQSNERGRGRKCKETAEALK
jgi:hypothetical protein